MYFKYMHGYSCISPFFILNVCRSGLRNSMIRAKKKVEPYFSLTTVTPAYYSYSCLPNIEDIIKCHNIPLTKTTTAQNEDSLSFYRVRGLYFLAVVFVRDIDP